MLCDNNETAMFVTLFYGVLEISTGVLRYANGGHNPPYVVRATGALEALQTEAGPILGVLEGATYEECTVTLQRHDAVFLFTDGVTEAEADGQGFFGEARLCDVLRGCGGATAQAMVTSVVGAVHAFTGAAPQSDDITALAMRYQPAT
jgi:sigma-B regulation protein RsbU (phosphoserine phosphatase)